MSTSYDIHCRDCGKWEEDWRDKTKQVWRGENTGFDDCREPHELEKCLTDLRPALETMGMAMKSVINSYFLVGNGDGNNLQRLAEYFGHHAGHDLVVMDEYGRTWAECLADWARHDAERAAKSKEQHA